MFCLAMMIAFLGNFSVPTKDECAEVVTNYLLEEGRLIDGDISLKDLEHAKGHFIQEILRATPALEETALFETTHHVFASLTINDIHKVNDHPLELYYTLPINNDEERTIHKIISTLADKNIIALLFERRDLERKGKQIEHLHPLRFLGSIFSNHHLRSAMREVKKNSFKWDGFMDGLVPRMKEEANKDNLHRYIPGFAEHVKADPERVSHYIRHRNWDGLVRYLL